MGEHSSRDLNFVFDFEQIIWDRKHDAIQNYTGTYKNILRTTSKNLNHEYKIILEWGARVPHPILKVQTFEIPLLNWNKLFGYLIDIIYLNSSIKYKLIFYYFSLTFD